MRLFAFVVVGFLAGVVTLSSADIPAPSDENVLFDAHIMSGRVTIFPTHMQAAIEALRAVDPGADDTGAHDVYARIYRGVMSGNLAVGDACAAKLLTGDACAKPFLPSWLVMPGTDNFTPQQLSAMADETAGAFMTQWSDLCAAWAAKTNENQGELCPME